MNASSLQLIIMEESGLHGLLPKFRLSQDHGNCREFLD